MAKFEWDASDSAPSEYPMRIIKGDLYFPDGGSLYIPDASSLSGGWGTPVSSHVVGEDFKPLPNELEITFYSFLEDTFYYGKFDLPYDSIRKHFDDGFFSFSGNEQITYRRIVTGVAPGGYLSVWLRGPSRQVLVFSGYAEKAEVPWSSILDDPDISRKKYVEEVLEYKLGKENLANIRKQGIPFGRWESYTTQYKWKAILQVADAPKIINSVEFFNAEKVPMPNGVSADDGHKPLPVPKLINFYWRGKAGEIMSVNVSFDEQEIFSAFNTMSPKVHNQKVMELLLSAKLDTGSELVTAGLRYEDELIPLVKTKTEIWGAELSPETIKLLW